MKPFFASSPEYTALFKMSRRARILEKRSPMLVEFLKTHGLGEPKSVEYAPLNFCREGFCFQNVDEQVRRMGGRLETGWVFWEYEEMSLQTEAHGIWIDPGGRRRDITPRELRPDKRVLFVPDPRVAEKRGYTSIQRTILSNNPRIVAIESFAQKLCEIWDKHFCGMGEEMVIPISEIQGFADSIGLPDEVAKWMVEKKVAHYEGR